MYHSRVRSTLEFAAMVFHGNLTKEHSRQIEMVLAIIMALQNLNLEQLDTQREMLSLLKSVLETLIIDHSKQQALHEET